MASLRFCHKICADLTDYPLGIVGTPRDYNYREFLTFGPMTPMFLADGVTISNPLVRALQAGGRDKSSFNDLWLKLGTEIEPTPLRLKELAAPGSPPRFDMAKVRFGETPCIN